MTKKERQAKKINSLMDGLFHHIKEEEVLRMNRKGVMFYEGKELTTQGKKSVAEGAKTILILDAWNAVLNDMRYLANKRMFDEATSIDDMLFGKAMLYTLSVMEKKMKNLSKIA